MLVLAFATARECAAALDTAPPEPGGWARAAVAGREALVLVTGVGPLSAALALGRLLGEQSPRGVVNLGVAGAFSGRLALGTTAVVREEIWPEYGLRTQEGVDARGLGFPLAETPGGPVYKRIGLDPGGAARELGLALPGDWPLAASLTVSGVSADAAVARSMARTYDPDMENMEGFALALGCLRAGLPFLEVRTVSNIVGPREAGGWDLPGALAALGRAARALLTENKS
ncbi:futalosine hydrolase [Desulfocurvus sp. DL9XJH121]